MFNEVRSRSGGVGVDSSSRLFLGSNSRFDSSIAIIVVALLLFLFYPILCKEEEREREREREKKKLFFSLFYLCIHNLKFFLLCIYFHL